MVIGIIALVAGVGGAVMNSSAQKKAAQRAAAEAKRLRIWYEAKARDTKQTLGREVETLRTLRSMDLPAHQQAAQTASLQRQKGSERMGRNRSLGRMDTEVRDAVFGGQLQQYLGREQARISQYTSLTKDIFSAASQTQQQVNALLQAGGSAEASLMGTAAKLDFEAGSAGGKALGALAQGFSLAQRGADSRKAMESAKEAKLMEGALSRGEDPAAYFEKRDAFEAAVNARKPEDDGPFSRFSRFLFGDPGPKKP